MHVCKRSWVLASAFLLAFCWLGYAAVSYRALYQGLEVGLPVAQKFAAEYGQIAFTAIPQEFMKNGWKFDENLPHGRS